MSLAEDIKKPFDRERQFANKRRAVILSAASAFRRQGYHNTSMVEIARSLGLTKPALYYYVSNKEEILFESHMIAYDAMDEVMKKSKGESGSAIDKLADWFREFVGLLTQSGVSLLTDVDSLTGERQTEVLARRGKIERAVTRLVKKGQSDGTIRPGDPRLHVFFFMGALNWLNAWFDTGGRLNGDDIADHFVAQLRHGIESKQN